MRILVLKCRRTRLKSEVVIWEKILIVEETHDQKTEKVKPKLSGEKMFQQNCLGIFTIGFSGFVLV